MKKCEEIQDLLSQYIDDYLNPEEKNHVDEHLKNCPICRLELANLKETVSILSNLGEDDLIPPASLRREIRKKVRKNNIKKSFIYKQSWRIWIPVAAVFVFFLVLPFLMNGFGLMGSKEAPQMAESLSPREDVFIADNSTKNAKLKMEEKRFTAESYQMQEERDSAGNIEEERKIIKTGNINLEVENYKNTVNQLQQLVSNFGGYIVRENTYVYDNDRQLLQGNLVIRIPAENFDQALQMIGEMGQSKNRSVGTADVTEEYVDLESRLKAMKLKEERLLNLLNKSGSLQDILAVENELARTRADIEALEGRIRYLNNQTELSTINISIKEVLSSVKTIKTTGLNGLWLRTKEAFIKSINSIIIGTGNLVVFLVGNIPYLILSGFIIVVLWLVLRKVITKYGKGEQ